MGKIDRTAQTDPRSHEGFIARAYDEGGLRLALKKAARLLQGYGDEEALDAAALMPPKLGAP